MGKEKSLTALEKALEFLRTTVKGGRWKQGDRLPTYRQLAQEADVGFVNMWRAITILKKEKILSFKTGEGIFLGKTVPQKHKEASHIQKTSSLELATEKIKKDILYGELSDQDMLPSAKQLAMSYSVGYRNLQKVIQTLVGLQILQPHKRWYRIYHPLFKSPSNTICLVMHAGDTNFEQNRTEKTALEEFVASLERECHLKNIRIVKETVTTPTYVHELANRPHLRSILGFVVWDSVFFGYQIVGMCSDLARYGKPVVVVKRGACLSDLEGKYPRYEDLQSLSKKYPFLFFSDIFTFKKAGQNMGRFLISKGYRKLCFIVHILEHESKDLFDGLCSALEERSLPASAMTLLRVDQISESERKALTADADKLIAVYNNEPINRCIEVCEKELPINPHLKKLIWQILEYRFEQDYLKEYFPVFARALALPSHTAWICAEDNVANFGVLPFLENKKVALPDKASVVGFGDMFESKINNLTTWHYDFAGAARKMLSFIMFPEYSKKTICIKGTNMFEIDGMVIDRGSV